MHKDNQMPRRQQQTYHWHAKKRGYKENIQQARRNIKKILSKPIYKPVIEFSGGKDSIVLLHLCMQEDNKIPIYNYHPGYAPHSKQLFRTQEVHEEIIKSAFSCGATENNFGVVNTPYFNGESYLIHDYFSLLFDYMDKRGLNLELLGIRGQESITRKHRVKGPLVRLEGYRAVSFPIRHLSVDDVWAYILENNLYYLKHYDTYGKIFGYDKTRFTSHFNKNELNVGGQYYFDKIEFIEDANKAPSVDETWRFEVNKDDPAYRR